ncbi:MAG: acetyl-CoA C-acetyltransferase [Propionibacteriaceae bacterium]|nr:acetyl-CoA C-acetyltransferase [Propionibacteriaceae bacterium]
MTTAVRRVAVLGGNRTPFARAGGTFAKASTQDLLTAALEGLIARFGLGGQRIGEVAAGSVMKHARDFNLTREAVLGTTLDPHTPAYDVQQACATGMQSTIAVANKIAVGQIDSGISGGADSASDAPIAVSEGLRRILLDLTHAKTATQRLKILSRFRADHLLPVAPSPSEPRTGLSMGEHMARINKTWGITRAEQDEFAAASHQNLAKAWDDGFFNDLVTSYLGVTRDTTLRPDTTAARLAELKTVFGKDLGDPTLTAGNSTPLTDGAATVLLGSEEWAEEHRLRPQAWFVDAETAAVDFVGGQEGMLLAPAYAAARLLQRNGLTLQDFDLYEIHEAFASTPLALMKAWESAQWCADRLGLEAPLGAIDRAKVNPHGGSVAAGHPFAATGARMLATTAKLLNKNGGRALVCVCAAGGLGVAAILEAA